ncbi:unnamed protein product [Symbiodinium natans]|uniref:Uncharacterized protein n=1 Tax=Symbiodinium natans TaxID=878477 RepID=A0A812TIT7_9DINO|nr:unnamed protein product [Symbiodinium natans]
MALAVLPLIPLLLAELVGSSRPEEACGVDAAAMSMLQLEKAQVQRQQECGHLLIDKCDPEANALCANNCRFHTHRDDCYRPIPDVLAEHPGVDGYCYFNYTAFWVAYAGPVPHYELEAVEGILGLRGPFYRGLHTGPVLTYNFEGVENLTTQMDSPHYSYDDLYAYSLGFLQGQGLDPEWMKNSSLWISLSKQKCDEIQATYNFSKEELVLADWLDRNMVISAMTMCSAGMDGSLFSAEIKAEAGYRNATDCQPVTHREFAKHHYVKCMLGYRNSAADMAYLNARACLLEGNHIGHFSDCPYSPPVDF